MIDKKLKYYAKKLNEDAPKGEFLAYINKKESNLLKQKGGLGIKTKSGIPSYIGSDASGQGGGSTGGGPGDASDSGNDGNDGNDGNGGDGGPRGPSELGVTTRAVNPVAISPVDRSAVSQFSTFGRNTMNQNLQGPSALSNITGGIKDYVMGGGLLGMGIRGLTNVFGGPKSFEDQYGYGPDYQGQKSYDFGPEDGPGNDDGNQGIMAAYNPYLLPEEEVLPTQEEEDFIQRFRVANEFRQDKQGQLDPAILEMISKLYT
jgi:hypothetical protein